MHIENHTIKHISFDPEAGALLIETYAQADSMFRLDSWENGFSFYKQEGHLTCSTRVNLSLFSPQQATQRKNWADCIALFTSKIPPRIKESAAPVSHAQLQTLQLLCQGGTGAIDVMEKAPALLWLIACDVLSSRISLNHAVNILKGKHLEIIRAIRADATRKHVNLLSKITPHTFCRKELRTLNRIVKDDDLQNHLRHLPQIALPQLEIVLDSPDILTIPCIQNEIANPDGSHYQLMLAKTMCESCLQIGQKAGLTNARHNLRNCKTLAEVMSLEKRWHGRYNRRLQEQRAAFSMEQEAAEVLNLTIEAEKERKRQARRERKRLAEERRRKIRKAGFPEPPIPGNQYIVPITTRTELKHEGELMNNCVATYEDKILFKNRYIYKVFYPERCTLEIISKPKFTIGELKAKNNAKPSKKAYQYVRTWINGQQGS